MATSAERQIEIKALRHRIELIVFKAGGWLTIANKMQTSGEALKRQVMSGAGKADNLRMLLGTLERIPPECDCASALCLSSHDR